MDPKQKKQKNLLKILLIFGGILVVGLIGAVIYFYAIEDTDQQEQTTQIACGCYMIDPAVINDCGDPKRAFIFNINKVQSDQTCAAVCDTNQISENILNSTTAKDAYKSCTVKSIADTRCENMLLKDGNGKLITGRVTPEDEINVEATFDLSTYKDYTFKINSNSEQPDKIEGNKIYKSIKELGDSDSIEILATAIDQQGDSINSIICRRVVEITQEGGTNVNKLQIATEKQTGQSTKISQVTITVGQLQDENVKVTFKFDNNLPQITAIDGLIIEAAKGTITIPKGEAYNPENFENSRDFSVLRDFYGEIEVTAEVYVNDTLLGFASTKINILNGDEGEETPEVPTETEDAKSNFSVAQSIGEQCVERVDTKNEATITITVKNVGTITDTIESIKNKLPLGFVYTQGSTILNGTAVADSPLLTVTPVGSTQELVWDPATPWSLESNATLTILFKATAGTNTITGTNTNEVIVNPTQIPTDPATLRAEATLLVAQDCTNPEEPVVTPSIPSTGILDSVIARVILGIIVIATGWFVYTKPLGTKISELIVASDAYKDLELTKYKVTNPKKYFEEKILRKGTKEN
jgi:hypothetical protein